MKRFVVTPCDDGDSLDPGCHPRQRSWDIEDRKDNRSVGNYSSRRLAQAACKALNEGKEPS